MNNNETEDVKKQWLLQNEIVCICKGIPRKRFMEALKSGAISLHEVNMHVDSGNGECKGERCGPRIEKMLDEYHAAIKKQV